MSTAPSQQQIESFNNFLDHLERLDPQHRFNGLVHQIYAAAREAGEDEIALHASKWLDLDAETEDALWLAAVAR